MQTINRNKAITPPYLKQGDTVGIFAPAKQIKKEDIDNAVALLNSWDLNVILANHLFDNHNQFAGTDENRAADLQSLWNNPQVKAIICARGGYGSMRTFRYINFNYIQHQPKWLVGFSDVTAFHTLFNCHLNLETIHGEMPLNFPKNGKDNESTQTLRQALFGTLKEYNMPPNKHNLHGQTTGRLIGGNLSILQSVAATPADIVPDNAILFIEEVDEYLYHIDRMMMNLKYSGKLAKLKAIITGGMTDIKDSAIPFGYNANEIIRSYAQEVNIPAIFDFPAGHQQPNVALYFGREIALNVTENGSKIIF